MQINSRLSSKIGLFRDSYTLVQLLAPTYLCDEQRPPADTQARWPVYDYVLPHRRLWTFDVLVCQLSATERFLLQPLVCGTVFHRMSLLPPLCPSSAVVLNHISSHFLIPLSDSSLICTVSAQWCQWLFILDTIIAITFNILTLCRPIANEWRMLMQVCINTGAMYTLNCITFIYLGV